MLVSTLGACATGPPPSRVDPTTPTIELACPTPLPPETSLDATIDAMPPMPPEGPRTFTIALATDAIEVARGERVTLDVRVERSGGFDEPVLVELAGLPDGLRTMARESRVEDATTTLTILSDVDGEAIERAAFVVQASSLDGLRQSAPAHVTVL